MLIPDCFLIIIITAGVSEFVRQTFMWNKMFIPPLNFYMATVLNIAYFQAPSSVTEFWTGVIAMGLCFVPGLLLRIGIFRKTIM